jgi:hypothetical protein
MTDFETGFRTWLQEKRRQREDRGQLTTPREQPEPVPGRSESAEPATSERQARDALDDIDEVVARITDDIEDRLHGTLRRAGYQSQAAEEPEPDGVLGYLVAYFSDGRVTGTTHTTLMSLEEARKEAKAHRVSLGRSCFPVELRQVDRG